MDTRATTDNNDTVWDRPIFSAIRVITALACQRLTLEEYTFTGSRNDFRIDESIYRSLKEFTAMKRLAVPRRHLGLTKPEFRNLSQRGKRDYAAADISPTSLFQHLPPKLEQLCLLVEKRFQWSPYPNRLPEQALADYGTELREWLLQIALHKVDNFPALRDVKIWKPARDENYNKTSRLAIFGQEILSAYEEVGITLSYKVSRDLDPFRD